MGKLGEIDGVFRFIISPNLKMEMWTGTSSRLTHFANELPLTNLMSSSNMHGRQMPIECSVAILVIYNDEIAVSTSFSGKYYLSVLGGIDRFAMSGGNIQPPMKCPRLFEWVFPHTKT